MRACAVASETAQAATSSAAQGPTDAPTFNTMRSHNHISGAQLLLPQIGTLYDSNLNMIGVGAYAFCADWNIGHPMQQHQQPGTSIAAAPLQPVDGFGSPVGEIADDQGPPPEDFGNLWCGDDGGGQDEWGEAPASPNAKSMNDDGMPPAVFEDAQVTNADLQPSPAGGGEGWDVGEEVSEEGLGVWEPLDPHEKTTGSKPFKQHIPKVPKCVSCSVMQLQNQHDMFRPRMLNCMIVLFSNGSKACGRANIFEAITALQF
jgi:hypothetical protein